MIEVRKLTGQPTPTGIGTGVMFILVDTDTNQIVSRGWNRMDMLSHARYLNARRAEAESQIIALGETDK